MDIIKKIIFSILKYISVINYYFVKKKFKKIVFLHIPHCGGNTIHRFLKVNFGLRGKKIIIKNTKKEIEILEDGKTHFYNFGHFGYDYIKKNFDDKSFFYTLNTRNPKNFYLSNYFRDKKYHRIYDPQSEFPTFEEYLRNNLKINKDNILCRYLSGDSIYQQNSIKMNNQIFEQALKNLNHFNFFFIVEKSKECLNLLPKKLGITINFASILKNHANKHSNSQYPSISNIESELLETMVYYDNKLYEIILKKKICS